MTHDGEDESYDLQIMHNFTRGKCYWNCLKVLETLAKYRDAAYVEGIAVKPTVSIHAHGWIELNGQIIDPTCPTSGLFYYTGFRFDNLQQLKTAMVQTPYDRSYRKDLPFYKRYGRNGELSAAFKEALANALKDHKNSTPYDPKEEL
jgi:hypothetical protein